uniref:Uncharacterized protein n=1 Tax=Chromera velia CCMP2878 TaxID=1169474 RepID=A0A0G4H570_9ALVE|eukprot:Cvel_24729.t1-p1 / transcript=Cvel_24729.t1 / gene=Cvel_24729 / organism=Chromera_velia_CCMP2878 / gene_product=hypothetical protein / transcript_product=hypothetical protein / location=Cvel_scaffold2714:10952-23768(+) / protein_length=1124 / sequence_SO=supercontig / SO=protein_coding / is_pseudo=false
MIIIILIVIFFFSLLHRTGIVLAEVVGPFSFSSHSSPSHAKDRIIKGQDTDPARTPVSEVLRGDGDGEIAVISCIYRLIVYTTSDLVPLFTKRPSTEFRLGDLWSWGPLPSLREAYEKMWELDPEKHRHNSNLYAVWNAKSFFVNEECSRGISRYCFWVDLGAFRTPFGGSDFLGPSAVARMDALHLVCPDCPIFGLIYLADGQRVMEWSPEKGPLATDMIEGGFYGGTPAAMQWFFSEFWSWHDFFLAKGFFVGKDQTIMNALLWWNMDRVLVLDTKVDHEGRCGDFWFQFEMLMRDRKSRPQNCFPGPVKKLSSLMLTCRGAEWAETDEELWGDERGRVDPPGGGGPGDGPLVFMSPMSTPARTQRDLEAWIGLAQSIRSVVGGETKMILVAPDWHWSFGMESEHLRKVGWTVCVPGSATFSFSSPRPSEEEEVNEQNYSWSSDGEGSAFVRWFLLALLSIRRLFSEIVVVGSGLVMVNRDWMHLLEEKRWKNGPWVRAWRGVLGDGSAIDLCGLFPPLSYSPQAANKTSVSVCGLNEGVGENGDSVGVIDSRFFIVRPGAEDSLVNCVRGGFSFSSSHSSPSAPRSFSSAQSSSVLRGEDRRGTCVYSVYGQTGSAAVPEMSAQGSPHVNIPVDSDVGSVGVSVMPSKGVFSSVTGAAGSSASSESPSPLVLSVEHVLAWKRQRRRWERQKTIVIEEVEEGGKETAQAMTDPREMSAWSTLTTQRAVETPSDRDERWQKGEQTKHTFSRASFLDFSALRPWAVSEYLLLGGNSLRGTVALWWEILRGLPPYVGGVFASDLVHSRALSLGLIGDGSVERSHSDALLPADSGVLVERGNAASQRSLAPLTGQQTTGIDGWITSTEKGEASFPVTKKWDVSIPPRLIPAPRNAFLPSARRMKRVSQSPRQELSSTNVTPSPLSVSVPNRLRLKSSLPRHRHRRRATEIFAAPLGDPLDGLSSGKSVVEVGAEEEGVGEGKSLSTSPPQPPTETMYTADDSANISAATPQGQSVEGAEEKSALEKELVAYFDQPFQIGYDSSLAFVTYEDELNRELKLPLVKWISGFLLGWIERRPRIRQPSWSPDWREKYVFEEDDLNDSTWEVCTKWNNNTLLTAEDGWGSVG